SRDARTKRDEPLWLLEKFDDLLQLLTRLFHASYVAECDRGFRRVVGPCSASAEAHHRIATAAAVGHPAPGKHHDGAEEHKRPECEQQVYPRGGRIGDDVVDFAQRIRRCAKTRQDLEQRGLTHIEGNDFARAGGGLATVARHPDVGDLTGHNALRQVVERDRPVGASIASTHQAEPDGDHGDGQSKDEQPSLLGRWHLHGQRLPPLYGFAWPDVGTGGSSIAPVADRLPRFGMILMDGPPSLLRAGGSPLIFSSPAETVEYARLHGIE